MAVRRGKISASGGNRISREETPLEIFERIQREGTGISRAAAEKFMAEVRRERRASGIKRGRMLEKAWAEAGRKY
jgi:hypothetical protein